MSLNCYSLISKVSVWVSREHAVELTQSCFIAFFSFHKVCFAADRPQPATTGLHVHRVPPERDSNAPRETHNSANTMQAQHRSLNERAAYPALPGQSHAAVLLISDGGPALCSQSFTETVWSALKLRFVFPLLQVIDPSIGNGGEPVAILANTVSVKSVFSRSRLDSYHLFCVACVSISGTI